jgi:hypothetical protein
MTFATMLTAAIGYALIYAAVPNRDALRAHARAGGVGRSGRAGIRRLLVAGGAMLLLSAVLGAIAYGPVIGPIVACAAAVTGGSVLVLIGPFFIRDPRNIRDTRETA